MYVIIGVEMIKLNKEKQLNTNNEYKDFFIKGVLPIFIYMTISLFGGDILTILGINVSAMSTNTKIIYSLILDLIILISILVIFRKDLKENWNDFKINNQKYFNKYFKYWLIGVGVMATSNLVITMITSSTSSNNQEAIMQIFKINPIYMFVSAVIIAPLTEELVFRLSFRNIIKSNFLFILMSGLIFGSMHVVMSLEQISDLLYIIPYSALGIAFAYMLTKSKNIIVPMSFHFIHNGIAMALEILMLILS